MLPELNVIKKSVDNITEFGGYNHNREIGPNEFYDDMNMTADEYPTLRPREKRNRMKLTDNSNGYLQGVTCSNNGLMYMLGADLYEAGKGRRTTSFGTGIGDVLISMGEKVVTFPNGKIYDTDKSSTQNITAMAESVKWAENKRASTSASKPFDSLAYTNTGETIPAGTYINLTYVISPTEHPNAYYYLDEYINSNYCYNHYIRPQTYDVSIGGISNCGRINYFKEVSNSRSTSTNTNSVRIYLTKDFPENSTLRITFTSTDYGWDVVDVDANPVVSIKLVDAELHDFPSGNAYTKSNEAPANPKDGDYWLDTSKKDYVLKVRSGGSWSQVLSAKYKITFNRGTVSGFKQYDTVTFDGTACPSYLKGDFTIQNITGNSIFVNGVFPTASETGNGYMRMRRLMPKIELATELNNRIWGCSSYDNEIYASKLGDPTNWYSYEDLSTDSFAVKVGSGGMFTAVCSYLDNVLFFKEDCIHVVYGNKPQNYAIKTIKCDGVAAGARDSIAVVNGVLYYKGKHGVYAYTGGYPTLVSNQFGMENYTGGKGGIFKNKYYIKFNEAAFTYDIDKGIWHRENMDEIISNMSAHYSDMYYISKTQNGSTWSYYLNKVYPFDYNNISEGDFDWYVETGDIGLGMPTKKWISRLIIRADMYEGSTFRVYAKYDDAEWKQIYEKVSTKFNSIPIPILPIRCDHMKLRIEGRGKVVIYNIARDIEIGSEYHG